ncbi:unnamed protein product [Cercospora beticola]|nr:unnamed protein product [Cercospora beticola]
MGARRHERRQRLGLVDLLAMIHLQRWEMRPGGDRIRMHRSTLPALLAPTVPRACRTAAVATAQHGNSGSRQAQRTACDDSCTPRGVRRMLHWKSPAPPLLQRRLLDSG